jgi:hypothetical protein
LRQPDYIDEETPGRVEIGCDDSRVIELHGFGRLTAPHRFSRLAL